MQPFQSLSDTFAALGDPTRLAILDRLASDGDMTVQEIARPFAMSLPAVSQHLKVLKQAGLVEERSEGVRRIYSIRREGLAELRDWLDSFWGDALEAFRIDAEKSHKQRGSKGE